MLDSPEANGDDAILARIYADAPDSGEFRKLRKRILRETRAAIDAYAMLPDTRRPDTRRPDTRRPDTGRPDTGGGNASRPRWLVCLSGGKDSYTLLAALTELRWRGLLPVDLLACNLDQGQPGFPRTVLPEYLGWLGVPHRIEYRDTYSIVTDKVPEGRTYCALCSRLRRGNLYRIAREEGCQAVVLGHHRDDMLETFMLNLFHGGRLAAMPPKLVNEEGDMMVLRPLAYLAEADCARFARAMKFPIIPCDLCGSQDGLQRAQIKRLLDEWERACPGRRNIMFKALTNVRPGHLADPALFDFAGLMSQTVANDARDQ